MANEYSFPFADSGGDRVYSDADFAKFYSAIFANGVFINVGGGLQVVDNGVGMNVLLKSGSANIGGRVYFLNADQAFAVPVASSTQDRVDSVVIRLDLSARSINAFYKQADTSVTRNSNTYELQIAKITVPKNANDILQQNIADMRTDRTVCGIASPNDPIDVTTFKAQFEATFNQQLSDNQTQFQSWFANLKSQLDSNQASNLQNQINNNATNIALKVDKSAQDNVKNWKPNTSYVVGDMVTFSSLGSISSGLLTNPIFIARQNHTSGSTFPESGDVKWQLLNPEAYTYNFFYGSYAIDFNFKRVGNMINVLSSPIRHTIGDGYNISKVEPNAGYLNDFVKPNFEVFLSTGGSIIQFSQDGTVIAHGSENKVGSWMSETYMAKNEPKWNSGVPT